MYIIYNLRIIYNIIFAGLMQTHTVQPVLSDSQTRFLCVSGSFDESFNEKLEFESV